MIYAYIHITNIVFENNIISADVTGYFNNIPEGSENFEKTYLKLVTSISYDILDKKNIISKSSSIYGSFFFNSITHPCNMINPLYQIEEFFELFLNQIPELLIPIEIIKDQLKLMQKKPEFRYTNILK